MVQLEQLQLSYKHDTVPPSLPVAVTVKFDSYRYSGPTLSDGTVPPHNPIMVIG